MIRFSSFIIAILFITLFGISCKKEDENGPKLKSEYGRFALVFTKKYSYQDRTLRIYENSDYGDDFNSYSDMTMELEGNAFKTVNLDNFCNKIDTLIPQGNVYYNGLVPTHRKFKIMIIGEILRNNSKNDTLIIDDIKINKDECYIKHIELD